MKALQFFLAALALATFSGCLQIEKLVKLKPDGSGTIEETLVMSKETVASLQKFTEGMAAQTAPATNPDEKPGKKKKKATTPAPAAFSLLDESKLKAEAEKMGEGVKFVSATKINDDKSDGYKAIFSFTDINKVKLDQNPGSTMPSPGGKGANEGPNGKSKKEPLTFHFTKGSPGELTISMPQPDAKAPPAQPQTGETLDMAVQAMRQIFKDMKVTIAVEVQGTIQETNAEYHDASRVTLVSVDFNKLVENPDKLKTLAQQNPQTLQASKALLKDLDGVKLESSPEVKVKFQ